MLRLCFTVVLMGSPLCHAFLNYTLKGHNAVYSAETNSTALFNELQTVSFAACDPNITLSFDELDPTFITSHYLGLSSADDYVSRCDVINCNKRTEWTCGSKDEFFFIPERFDVPKRFYCDNAADGLVDMNRCAIELYLYPSWLQTIGGIVFVYVLLLWASRRRISPDDPWKWVFFNAFIYFVICLPTILRCAQMYGRLFGMIMLLGYARLVTELPAKMVTVLHRLRRV